MSHIYTDDGRMLPTADEIMMTHAAPELADLVFGVRYPDPTCIEPASSVAIYSYSKREEVGVCEVAEPGRGEQVAAAIFAWIDVHPEFKVMT